MAASKPLPRLAISELFGTLLPDFVLASTLLMALTYAVPSRRLHHQGPAVAVSATMNPMATRPPRWSPSPGHSASLPARSRQDPAGVKREHLGGRLRQTDASLRIAELRRQMHEEDARIGHGAL